MCLFRRTTRLWGRDAICPRCAPTWTPPWVAWPSWGLVSSFSAAVRHGRRRRDMTDTGCPARFFEFLALAAEAAAPYDLDIVIEPLWREKCDTINTVLEAAVVARQTEIPRVAALADWWHMWHEREPLTNVAEARDRLRHVHVPVPPLPSSTPQSTDAGLPDFLRALTAMDYSGRVSIEDNGRRFDSFERQAPQALAYLRAHLRR